MTVYEYCPVCKKDLPENLEANFCPFCGVRLHPNAAPPPDEPQPFSEPEPPETPQRHGIPWENATDLGFLQRLSQTWSESLFNAVAFFRNMPIGGSIAMAFIYGLLFKVLGYIFSIFWQRDSLANLEKNMQDMPAVYEDFIRLLMDNPIMQSPELQFLLAPIIGIFTLFFASLILHLSLSIFGGAKNGYATTFRVVAYAESSAIFHAIPYIGGLFANVFWLVLLIIGFREAHETTTGKSLLGVFAPVAFCCCLAAFAIYGFTSSVVNSGL